MLFTTAKQASIRILGRSGALLVTAALLALGLVSCGESSPGATKCVDYLGLSDDARQDAVSDTAQQLHIELLSPGIGGKGAPQLYDARVAVDARCRKTPRRRLEEVVAGANLAAPGTAPSQRAADSAPAASTPTEQGASRPTSCSIDVGELSQIFGAPASLNPQGDGTTCAYMFGGTPTIYVTYYPTGGASAAAVAQSMNNGNGSTGQRCDVTTHAAVDLSVCHEGSDALLIGQMMASTRGGDSGETTVVVGVSALLEPGAAARLKQSAVALVRRLA